VHSATQRALQTHSSAGGIDLPPGAAEGGGGDPAAPEGAPHRWQQHRRVGAAARCPGAGARRGEGGQAGGHGGGHAVARMLR